MKRVQDDRGTWRNVSPPCRAPLDRSVTTTVVIEIPVVKIILALMMCIVIGYIVF